MAGEINADIERVFEGTIALPSRYTGTISDSEALSFLKNLPETGSDLSLPLNQWSKYLDWRQKLAEEKANEEYPYTEWKKSDRGNQIEFLLKEPGVREKLKLRFVNESLRVCSTADAPVKRGFQGEFKRIENPDRQESIRGRGNYHLRNFGDPKGTPEKLQISLAADSLFDEFTNQDPIPKTGILRVVMEGELSAVDIQQNGLQRLAEHRGLNPSLRDWIFDIKKALPCPEPPESNWIPDGQLNSKQHACVSKALALEDLLLLWGPPGTGKTTVIAEIASQYCRQNRRVLISSQANLAVDQALERLPNLSHIRPARVSTSKKKESLAIDAKVWIKRWFGAIAHECKSKIKSETDSRWKELKGEWSNHLRTVNTKGLSNSFEQQYLKLANVIGATCLETGKPEFRSRIRFDPRFDLTIVDEVSKATPPEVLLPALMGRRTLLVGDHRQLPPVFKDSTFPEAVENKVLTSDDLVSFREMVTTSLFESYYQQCDPSIRCGLDEQYRMHPDIMHAVNLFYADQPLAAGDGEKKRSAERVHSVKLIRPDGRPWLVPGKHLVWIDSAKDEFGASVGDERVGTSRLNMTEARICARLIGDLLEARLSVAVISFYRAQIQELERQLRLSRMPKLVDFVENKNVNTVDQFQGSERDVVIVSLTRTDHPLTGEFVSDFRRINVAISRAKRLLIILGSSRSFDSGSVKVPSSKLGTNEAVFVYRRIRELAVQHGTFLQTKDILPI